MDLDKIEQKLSHALDALEQAKRQRNPEDTHAAILRAVTDTQPVRHKLAKEEVRPATFKSLTFASEFRISSEMPSEKYSWSLSGDISANGSTAIDADAGPTAGSAAGAGARACAPCA